MAFLRGKRRSCRSSPARLRSRLTTSSASLRSRIVKPGSGPGRARRAGGRYWRRSGTSPATRSQLPPTSARTRRHLLRRLAREREQEDLRRRHARSRTRRATRWNERPRPAAARTRDHQHAGPSSMVAPRAARRSARRHSRCGSGERAGASGRGAACRYPCGSFALVAGSAHEVERGHAPRGCRVRTRASRARRRRRRRLLRGGAGRRPDTPTRRSTSSRRRGARAEHRELEVCGQRAKPSSLPSSRRRPDTGRAARRASACGSASRSHPSARAVRRRAAADARRWSRRCPAAVATMWSRSAGSADVSAAYSQNGLASLVLRRAIPS